MTVAAFLAQAGNILRNSGRVYRWVRSLVYECQGPEGSRLQVLASDSKAEPSAGALLTNLVVIGVRGEGTPTESLLPSKLVGPLLMDEDLCGKLPAIRHYSVRPVFNDSFLMRGPGWHAAEGFLIHGQDITPDLTIHPLPPNPSTFDRLPPYTRRLLQDFCWASEADLTNAVGVLLTGMLANHFIDKPKPVFLIDGNQRGLGKTLFCQVVGRILDGVEPCRLSLSGDEELEKKLGASIKESPTSILFFDNVRGRINSPVIEANALSPILQFRWLGRSSMITRPNYFLWFITSNQTTGTEDLVSRALPIRLRYEGNPRDRSFANDPLAYATRYRLEILGELAGMVVRWQQAGMPQGPAARSWHRCIQWHQIIGNILSHAGFDQFLSNLDEAEAAMDEGLQALEELADYVVTSNMRHFFVQQGASAGNELGRLPKQWVEHFTDAQVYTDKLISMSGKGRQTWVGTFLSSKVGRTVEISTNTGPATATLRKHAARGGQKRYYFEIAAAAVAGELQANPGSDLLASGGVGPSSHAPSPPPPPQPISASASPEVAAPTKPLEVIQPAPVAAGSNGPGNDLAWL
jgi:hypothetical protein